MRPRWGNVGRESLVDIGIEGPPYVVEPLVDPVPRERDVPEHQPDRHPAPVPAREPEKVPA